jgi:hypothetical protein
MLMAMEPFTILMETNTKVNTRIIKQMEGVFMPIKQEQSTMGCGRMINNMGKDSRYSKTALNMMDLMSMGRKKEVVCTIGQMALYIVVIGLTIRFMEKVHIFGTMEESILVSGQITIWMDMEFMFGVMAENTKDSFRETKRMVTAFISG